MCQVSTTGLVLANNSAVAASSTQHLPGLPQYTPFHLARRLLTGEAAAHKRASVLVYNASSGQHLFWSLWTQMAEAWSRKALLRTLIRAAFEGMVLLGL